MKDLTTDIHRWVIENRSKLIETVRDLVRFDTVNRVLTGTEYDCQMHIADLMRGLDLQVDVFSPEEVTGFHDHPAYYPGKNYTNRPNVVGVWNGKGDNGRSLLFSSHIDTAAIAPGWPRDPFTALEEDGKLYGLGTFDMKGGFAASLLAVQCLMDLGYQPYGDVIIESVVDEEFGGANGTLAARLRGYQADAAIIPEPTNFDICPAHRGGAMWRVTFHGSTGMSFSGETILNPATVAGKFIAYLDEFEKNRALQPGPAPWYTNSDSTLPVMVTRIVAGDLASPLCDVGPTTCEVDVWVECYPGVDEDTLKDQILSGFYEQHPTQGVRIEFEKVIRFLPGSEVTPDFPLVRRLETITSEVLREPAIVRGAPFACDAFMFNLFSSTPALVFGPPGANAHAPDEYVEIDGLCQLTEIFARAIVDSCSECR